MSKSTAPLSETQCLIERVRNVLADHEIMEKRMFGGITVC